jgi:hypothetical protein
MPVDHVERLAVEHGALMDEVSQEWIGHDPRRPAHSGRRHERRLPGRWPDPPDLAHRRDRPGLPHQPGAELPACTASSRHPPSERPSEVHLDSQVGRASGLTLGYLYVPAGAEAYLDHPEHGNSGIAPGRYALRRERETTGEIRLVHD